VSTYYLIKLRNNSNKIELTVNSKYAKRVHIITKGDVIEDVVDLKSINNFKDLAKLQNEFTPIQIKKIAESLDLKELLFLILNETKSYNNY
jgi:cobyric acid synthase